MPKREGNNYRLYDVNEISRLEMIVLYRKMGFSIEAIRDLIDDSNNKGLLSQFVDQYNILNHHIHTMNAVRETLGQCIEKLINNPMVDDFMIEKMEETANTIALSEEWQDKWNFDSWAENYDKDIRAEGKGLNFYKNYDTVIVNTAAMVNGDKVVEIGIGTGNLAKNILKNGVSPANYVGIDQSVNMLKEARKKCSDVQLRIGDFLHLPLEDNTYDTIVTSYAFHHCNFKEKEMAIAEMNRVIKHRGRIIITDLMFESSLSRERFEKVCTVEEKQDLEDEYFGNVDEIELILKNYEFTCEHQKFDDLIWMIVADRK